MNINKFVRIVCISCLILILLIFSVGISYSATESELNQQSKDLDEKIKQLNTELAGTKSKMTENLNQINKLNTEISTYENEISDLNDRIGVVNAQITEKEQDIAEQEEKYRQQKEALDKRLVALYENGETSYLDMLLSSDGLADFISNYYMISQLAEFDQELLDGIANTRDKIQAEKDYLDSAKNEITTTKSSIENKQNSLAATRNQKSAVVKQLSAEEAEIQEELEETEKHKREVQSKIASLASKYTGQIVAPSAAGYISPLPGRTKANITTPFGGYRGHEGADFACPAGTPVLAVKAGTVVTSTAKKKNGKYVSYGEYIIINHGDGTMTLYAHMLPNSRRVSENDTVSQGQQIGQVGTTGNSSGNHLHFEVWSGKTRVNPAPYLP